MARMSYAVGDPVEEMLQAEARADHAQATARGERILRVADAAVSQLAVSGRLPVGYHDDVRAAVFMAVSDEFYGNAAIDLPTNWKGTPCRS